MLLSVSCKGSHKAANQNQDARWTPTLPTMQRAVPVQINYKFVQVLAIYHEMTKIREVVDVVERNMPYMVLATSKTQNSTEVLWSLFINTCWHSHTHTSRRIRNINCNSYIKLSLYFIMIHIHLTYTNTSLRCLQMQKRLQQPNANCDVIAIPSLPYSSPSRPGRTGNRFSCLDNVSTFGAQIFRNDWYYFIVW